MNLKKISLKGCQVFLFLLFIFLGVNQIDASSIDISNTTVSPYKAIVYIEDFNDLSSLGTGFIVGTEYVVTAAHVVWDHDKQKVINPKEHEIYVVPGKNKDINPYGDFKVTEIKVPQGYRPSDENAAIDYALLKIEQRNGVRIGDVSPPLKFKEVGNLVGQSIYTIGYPANRPSGTMVALHNASVNNEWGALFEFSGLDITSGFSGSPIFNKQEEVIGIVTAAADDSNGKKLNFGVKFNHEVYNFISNGMTPVSANEFFLYTDSNAGGNKHSGIIPAKGHLSVSNTDSIGRQFSDTISSVVLPPRTSMRLYEHTNYGGREKRLFNPADTPQLFDLRSDIYNFGDITSSFIIEKQTEKEDFALWTDSFGGGNVYFGAANNAGGFDLPNTDNIGRQFSDTISSIVLPPRSSMIIYEHINYGGRCKTLLNQGDNVLLFDLRKEKLDFGDVTSSLKFRYLN